MTTKKMNYTLWTVQVLLALLFLWAGAMKLLLPIEAMTKQIPLPGGFLRFIGTAEVFGAIGLILPGWMRIRLVLTPLAAAGLSIIMIGATTVTLVTGGGAVALMPLGVGILAVIVMYGRRKSALQENFIRRVDLADVRSTYSRERSVPCN